jgi:hypothetical protein
VEPNELLEIFRTHIVVVRGQLISSGEGQGDHVRLVDRPTDQGCFSGFSGESTAVGVKAIMAAGPGEEGAFPAFICNYEQNQVHQQTLGNDPRFMFTPTMNGCTFGIGSPAEGALIVTHANRKLPDKPDRNALLLEQAAAQAQQTSGVLAHGGRFGPEQYQFGANRMANMTLFGVFDGGWRFYYQQYMMLGWGNSYRLLTFQEVTQNRLEVF